MAYRPFKNASCSSLLERWTPEQVGRAVADGSSIRIRDESLQVVFALRETEPVLRVANYISQHPVTVSLLKRAQHFAKRDVVGCGHLSDIRHKFPGVVRVVAPHQWIVPA